jgi:ADP-heptose:LPS heptosyltransferase
LPTTTSSRGGRPIRIVLSRLDRVGDLILSTPAIASVRRSWPEARVTMVCSRHNSGVVQGNPDIDELVIAEPGDSIRSLGARFRGETDLAIALAPRTMDFVLAGATRAPRRVGYTYVRRYATRLTARLYLTDVLLSEADPELCDRDAQYAVRHEVDQVLSLVTSAGGDVLTHDLVLAISDADRARVADVPAGGIAFQLAPRWLRDGSTLGSTLALIGDLRRFGLPIVATYGSDSVDLAKAVRSAGVADVVVGDLPFAAWAAVFEKSALVVTVDTGATHVASATKRPTVVLFERRYFNLSSQEWAPYRVPSVILRKPADEMPASLAGLREQVIGGVEALMAPCP